MKPTTILTALAATATLATTAATRAANTAEPPARRPNIIFFLADDQGYGDLDKFNSANILRNAREGHRIDQFYVAAPICSPSRVGLTTGTYPQRWRITSFLANTHENAARGMPNYLDPKAPTLARVLQQAGYATGHFGKWHMGGQRDFADAPPIQTYGFDQSLTQFEGPGDRILPVFSNGKKTKLGLDSEKLGRGKITWINRWDVTATFIDRAIKFINENKKTGKPFYVNIWPDDVHAPHDAGPVNRGNGTPAANYAGVMKEFDRQFGRLMDYIRADPDLRDNTIVIYASDNGSPADSLKNAGSSNGHLRGGKGNIYEGGFREPFIIWAPKLLAPAAIGTKNTTSVVAAIDLAPSLLSILNIPTPPNIKFDGIDRSDILLGRSAAPNRPAPLYWSRPPGAGGPTPDYAIRDGNWNLHLTPGKPPELYDIPADPSEKTNQAKANPDIVKTLSAKIAAWQKDVNYLKIPPPAGAGPGKAGKKGAKKAPPITSTDEEE